MVGSLFSWKSLLTKRITSDDYDPVSLARIRTEDASDYLSNGGFTEQDQLHAAARLRLRRGVRHGEFWGRGRAD
jgi:hypothetical protein